MDIQLDFPPNAPADQAISLASLLRRFCADERVGDHGKGYACSNCGGGAGAVSCYIREMYS
jgi:ubiquitin carboxyl-terminal hydrolase 22/27/51